MYIYINSYDGMIGLEIFELKVSLSFEIHTEKCLGIFYELISNN